LQSFQALSTSDVPSNEPKVDLTTVEDAAEGSYIHTYIHTCIHQVPFLATYLHIEFFSAAGKSVSFWRPVDKSNALTEHLADLDAIHFYSAVNFGQSTLILAYIFLF